MITGKGPTLTTDVEWDAFFAVLEKAVIDWAVRIENPDQTPVELLVQRTTYTEDGEPAVVGRLFSDGRGDWLGDEVTVILSDDVTVVIL